MLIISSVHLRNGVQAEWKARDAAAIERRDNQESELSPSRDGIEISFYPGPTGAKRKMLWVSDVLAIKNVKHILKPKVPKG
jgi:hypothetical protein